MGVEQGVQDRDTSSAERQREQAGDNAFSRDATLQGFAGVVDRIIGSIERAAAHEIGPGAAEPTARNSISPRST